MSAASCRRCGHPLTAAASVRRGLGPVCLRYGFRADVLAVALVDLATLATEAAATLVNRPPAELAHVAEAVDTLAALLWGEHR